MPNSVQYDGVDDQTVFNGVPAPVQVSGAHTLLTVERILTVSDTAWQSSIETETSGITAGAAFGRDNGGNVYWSQGTTSSSAVGWTDSDNWVVAAASKPAGTSTPRLHKCVFGGGNTHTDGAPGSNAASASITGGTVRIAGNDDFSNKRLTAAAIFDRVLSDAEIDGIKTAATTASIIALGPVWCVDSNDNFATDYMGNLNRSSVVGTTDNADGPAGWVLGSGGPGPDLNTFRPARPPIFRMLKHRPRSRMSLPSFQPQYAEPVSTAVEWFLTADLTLDHTIAGAQDRETFQATAATLPITLAGAQTRETSLTGAMAPTFVLTGDITRVVFLTGAVAPTFTLTGAIDRVATLTGAVTVPITLAGAQTRSTFQTGTLTPTFTLTGAQTRETSLAGAMAPTLTLTGAQTRTTFLTGTVTPTVTFAGALKLTALIAGATTVPITLTGAQTRTTFLVGAQTAPITLAGDPTIVTGPPTHQLATSLVPTFTLAGATTRSTSLATAATFSPSIVGAVVRTTSLTGAVAPTFTLAGAQARTTSITGAVTLTPVLDGQIRRLSLLVGTITLTPTITGGISVGASHSLTTTFSLPVSLAGNIALLFTETPGIGGIVHVHPGHALGSHSGRLDPDDVPQPGHALGLRNGHLAKNKEGAVS